MASCINRNTSGYKELKKISGLSEAQLDAVIEAYQQKYPGQFPTEAYIKANDRIVELSEKQPKTIKEYELINNELVELSKAYPSDRVNLPVYDQMPASGEISLDVDSYSGALEKAIGKLDALVKAIESIDATQRTDTERRKLAQYKDLLGQYRQKKKVLPAENMAVEMLGQMLQEITELGEIGDALLNSEDSDYLQRVGIQELQTARQILAMYRQLITDTGDDFGIKVFKDAADMDILDEQRGELLLALTKAEEKVDNALTGVVKELLRKELTRRKAEEEGTNIAEKEITKEAIIDGYEGDIDAEVEAMFDGNIYKSTGDSVWNLLYALDMSGSDPLASALKVEVDKEEKATPTKYILQRLHAVSDDIKKKANELFQVKNKRGFKRLISKFSETYYNALGKIEELNDKIRDLQFEENSKAKRDTRQRLIRERASVIRKNFDVVDVRLLPEVQELKDFPELGTEVTPEGEAYKASLISRLGNGNKEIGTMLYNEMVAEQIAKLYEFKYTFELRQNKVYLIEDETQRTEAQEKLDKLKSEQDPVEYHDTLARERARGYKDKKAFIEDNIAKVYPNYISLIPKEGDSSMFDEKFEKEIETNPEHLQAWYALREATVFHNKNRLVKNKRDAYDTDLSLPYASELIEGEIPELAKRAPKLAQNLIRSTLNFFDRVGIAMSKQVRGDKDKIFDNLEPGKTKLRPEDVEQEGRIRENTRTINEEAQKRLRRGEGTYGRIKIRLGLGNMYDRVALSSATKKVLSEELGSEAANLIFDTFVIEAERGDTVKLDALLYQDAIKQVEKDMENIDMFDSLHNATLSAGRLRFQKRMEPKVLFLSEYIGRQNLTESGDEVEKDKRLSRTKRAVDYFVEKKFYNNEGIRDPFLGNLAFTKVLTREDRNLKKRLKEDINNLRSMLSDPRLKGMEKDIQAEIADLESVINSLGRVITLASGVEGILLRLKIFISLGYNPVAQLNNFLIGRDATGEGEGLFWTRGNLRSARNYMGQLSITKSGVATKEQKEQAALTSELLNLQGVFQNSYNELEDKKTADLIKSKTDRKESKFNKQVGKFKEPFYLVEETERAIQTPLILSMLADVTVKDSNGNEVPVFNKDWNVKGSPYEGQAHPAFYLDNGVLKLKPEFDTEQNRETWLYQNSQKHADIFADSGYIPVAIRTLHGDYANNTTILGKSNVFGRIFMMFKTWAPMFFKWKKQLVDTALKVPEGANAAEIAAAQSRAKDVLAVFTLKNLMTAVATTATLSAFFGSSVLFGLFAPGLILSFYMSTKNMTKTQRLKDLEKHRDALSKTKYELERARLSIIPALKNLGLNSLRTVKMGRLIALKGVQQSLLLNNAFIELGSRITDDRIATLAGIDPELKEQIAAYNALLIRASSSLQSLILKTAIATLMHGLIDDDEEEELFNARNKQSSKDAWIFSGSLYEAFRRATDNPALFFYNLTTNINNRIIQESSMETDLTEIFGLIYTKNPLADFVTQLDDIRKEKSGGINEGQSGFSVFLEKNIPFDLGLSTITEQVYDPSWVDKLAKQSEAEKFQERRSEVKDTFDQTFEDVAYEIAGGNPKTSDDPKVQAIYNRIKGTKSRYSKRLFPTGNNTFFNKAGEVRYEPGLKQAETILERLDNMSVQDREKMIKALISEYITDTQ